MLGRVAGSRSAGQGAAAAAGGAANSGGGSSQVLGLVQSVIGLADESKNLIKEVAAKPFDSAANRVTANLKMGTSSVNHDANGLIQQLDILPESVKKFSQALKDITNSIVERGNYLGSYNSNLAMAGGQADVRKIQTDIREASYVGQSYSRVIDEQSKAESKLADILNPINDSIAKGIGDLLEILNSLLDYVRQNIDSVVMIVEVGKAIFQVLTFQMEAAQETWRGIPDAIVKAMKAQSEDNEFVRDIFKNTIDVERLNPNKGRSGVAGDGPGIGFDFGKFR